MNEQVEIVISPGGDVTVGVKCVKGKACHKVTEEIEKALGKKTADVATPEMYEAGHVQHHR